MADNRRWELLEEIDELQFVAIELNLFLDTHPDNQQAIRDHYQVTQRLDRLIVQYERTYGPLTAHGLGPTEYPWRWIEEPWPWQRREDWRD